MTGSTGSFIWGVAGWLRKVANARIWGADGGLLLCVAGDFDAFL